MTNLPLDIKYRPKVIEEMVGNTRLIQNIKGMLENKTLPKFIILNGYPGCGKSTLAFIIAKTLKCRTYNGTDICGECRNCKGIDETLYSDGKGNSAFNIFTFDMGLNSSEEYVNDIATSIGSGSIDGSTKVMIIEELQRVKKDTQDSLLRTLEFIPDNVYVIVTTSDMIKINKALISRATVFKLNPPSKNELLELVKDISLKEDIRINKSQMELIITASHNLPRQILKKLEMVEASGENAIEYLEELRNFDYEPYIDFFDKVSTGLTETLIYINDIRDKEKFVHGMKFYIQDYMKVRYSPTLLTINSKIRNRISKSLIRYNDEMIMTILDDLIKLKSIDESDAEVLLLSISFKLNTSSFKAIMQKERIVTQEKSERFEPELEELSKALLESKSAVFNVDDL